MKIQNFQDELMEGILHVTGDDLLENALADHLEIENISTFDEEGVAASDHGLVVYMADGSVFHLTITKEE